MVKLLKPSSLQLAYEQARLEELYMEAVMKKSRVVFKTGYSNQSSGRKGGDPAPLAKIPCSQGVGNTEGTSRAVKQSFGTNDVARKEILDQRRHQELCFRCGEKFHSGYQCKMKALHRIEGAKFEGKGQEEMNEVEGEVMELQIEESQLSIHALSGSTAHSTIKDQGSGARENNCGFGG